MKNFLDDFFEEMAEKNRQLSRMLNGGFEYDESMCILYGDETVEETKRMMVEIEIEKVRDKMKEEKEIPAMTVCNSVTKLPFEPGQAK